MLYEKAFNNKMLGRAREITSPSKVHTNMEMYMRSYPDFGCRNFLSALFRPIAKVSWWFHKDMCDMRGISLEDSQIYMPADVRRSAFFEHIQRESMHPMNLLLYKYRIQRYFKVDLALSGFHAPDYIKEEARNRTYIKGMVNMLRWRHFVEHNYESDMTQNTYVFSGTMVVIDFLMAFNVLKRSAWTRYFYNEAHTFTQQVINEDLFAGNKPLDFTVDADWEIFKQIAERDNQDFPGFYSPEGEKIDFVALRKMLADHQKELKYNKLTNEDINEIGAEKSYKEHAFIASEYPGEKVVGSNTVGKDMPEFIRQSDARGLFN